MNRISIEQMKHMPVGQLVTLAPAQLVELIDQADRQKQSAEIAAKWLRGALHLQLHGGAA